MTEKKKQLAPVCATCPNQTPDMICMNSEGSSHKGCPTVTRQELLAKARDEAEKLKVQIVKETEKEREETLRQARSQSEDIIKQADKSRQLLISEINERISKAAIEKACELIQKTLPNRFKEDVHSHWVEELIESDFNRLERLQIPEGIKEITLTSAFNLSDKQRATLSKKLKTIMGRDIVLKEEVDPKVVAGLVIHIGSLVMDGSLRNRILEKAKSI